MFRYAISLTLLVCMPLWLQAQQSTYFNHTEFGASFGGTKAYETFNPRLNFSFESFNGVTIHPKHAVGMSIGYDRYPGVDLVPISFGWRGFRDRGGRINIFAASNIGYASAALMKREKTDLVEQWHEGGLMYSASIGIRKKARNNNHAFTWSIGYKRQQAYYFQSYLDPFFMGFSSFRLPPGASSIVEEALTFNSLTLKWGFQF